MVAPACLVCKCVAERHFLLYNFEFSLLRYDKSYFLYLSSRFIPLHKALPVTFRTAPQLRRF